SSNGVERDRSRLRLSSETQNYRSAWAAVCHRRGIVQDLGNRAVTTAEKIGLCGLARQITVEFSLQIERGARSPASQLVDARGSRRHPHDGPAGASSPDAEGSDELRATT